MVKVIALQEVHYASIARVPGTPSAEFDASEPDADILSKIGKVAYVLEKPAEQPAEPVKPEPEKANTLFAKKEEATEEDKAPRRRYMRRDLRAEE